MNINFGSFPFRKAADIKPATMFGPNSAKEERPSFLKHDKLRAGSDDPTDTSVLTESFPSTDSGTLWDK